MKIYMHLKCKSEIFSLVVLIACIILWWCCQLALTHGSQCVDGSGLAPTNILSSNDMGAIIHLDKNWRDVCTCMPAYVTWGRWTVSCLAYGFSYRDSFILHSDFLSMRIYKFVSYFICVISILSSFFFLDIFTF